MKKGWYVRTFEEYTEAVSEELKTWQKRRNRTTYISKKFLQNNLCLIFSSYRDYMNALWFLRNYPEVKYFYIDKKTGELKPSKRKK